MKKKRLSELSKQLRTNPYGQLEGGFALIVSTNHVLIIGGEDVIGGAGGDTNNCNGGNCASGCGTTNNVPGCGTSTNKITGCGGGG